MLTEIKRGVLFTVVTMLLFGGGYHLLIRGIALMFPQQAEGSLIRRADGTVVGSSLIAQNFTKPEYFHPRPSAVDYNAASTGGTNYGPSNSDHLKAVRERVDAVAATEGTSATDVPSEMITASGAGLDPHIPPNAAELQVARVARARNAETGRIRELVRAHTDGPSFGIFGRARVNVLELNLALDQMFAMQPQSKSGMVGYVRLMANVYSPQRHSAAEPQPQNEASPIWSAAAAAAAFVCHRQRANIQKLQLRLQHSKTLPCSMCSWKSLRPNKNLLTSSTEKDTSEIFQ